MKPPVTADMVRILDPAIRAYVKQRISVSRFRECLTEVIFEKATVVDIGPPTIATQVRRYLRDHGKATSKEMAKALGIRLDSLRQILSNRRVHGVVQKGYAKRVGHYRGQSELLWGLDPDYRGL